MKTKLLLITLVLVLAACAPGSGPQLIGSAPQGGAPTLLNSAPPAPPGLAIVYSASMELAVRDVTRARAWVSGLASEMNGYLLAERTWTSGFEQNAEVTMAVPAARLEPALNRLRGYGSVRAESKTGQLLTTDAYGASGYSNLTVTLRPDAWAGVGDFFGGLLWVLAALAPPSLMLIGAVTVLRTVVWWWKRRTA
jgi:hypothetical protein